MGKIMTQVVEREVGNKVVLVFGRELFKSAKPVMDASLGQLGVALRGKDVRKELSAVPWP